jgi:membrane-bound lytic murein transglycosylase D
LPVLDYQEVVPVQICEPDDPQSIASANQAEPVASGEELGGVEQAWPQSLMEEWELSAVPGRLIPSVERPVVGWGPTPRGELPTGWIPVEAGRGIAPGGDHYPVVTNSQVGFFIERFTRERREVISQWLNRAGPFLSMIRETLSKHGLPEELAFTAMIESGFNPVATSHAGARGLWQFMATTARRYGLRIDQWVDERLDPEKSTVAAAAYLRDLYNLFGSWNLAQAAYNAGEGTVSRAIRATGSSDFWTLARSSFLHRETKDFVPQILAATHIGREPIRYGFEPLQPTTPAVERVSVPGSTDLRWVSASSGISIDALRSLNPELVKGVTPPGATYDLSVPEGSRSVILGALVQSRRASAGSGPPSSAIRASTDHQQVHVVRPRDTLNSIARRYGVSVGDMLRWNSLATQDRIRPGDRLQVGTPGGR